MKIEDLVRVADSVEPVLDATYEDIGRNYARKWFKEKNSDEGFEESFARWRYRNKEESVRGAKDEMSLLMRKAALRKDPNTREKADDEAKKEELYKLTEQFVRKYQPQYYKQYKGDIQDLVSDFYAEFTTKKSRVAGKEESLLDKYDENVTSFPYLVKVAVQRMLIDRSRKDKGEQNITEKYDEETGELSLDYLASSDPEDDSDVQLEDIEFSDDQILELRDRWDEMTDEQRKPIINYYNEVKNVLAPNFKKLFADIIEGKVTDSHQYVVDSLASYFKIEDAEKVELGKDKPYSMYELQNKPPKWIDDLILWDEIVKKATHDGEKEVKIVVPLSMYKRAKNSDESKGKKNEFSLKDLKDKAPSWAKDKDLWEEIIKKATHDGEKEVKYIVPLSMYKKASKVKDSHEFYDFIKNVLSLKSSLVVDLPVEGFDAQIELDCDSTGWDIELVVDGDRKFIASGEGCPSEVSDETISYIDETISSALTEFTVE